MESDLVNLAKLMLSGMITAAVVTSADAQGIKDLTTIVSLRGQCSKLMIAKVDFSSDCQGKLMNTAYKSGRTGFTFWLGDGFVTFSGADSPAMGIRASVSLDRVLLARVGPERDSPLVATGTCTYTNPWAGPSHVNCRAFTKLGMVTASFVSDGQEPDISSFE